MKPRGHNVPAPPIRRACAIIRRGVNTTALVCTTFGVWISAGLLIYMVIHMNVEIILRSGFGLSTDSMAEFVGYAMGAMTYLSLSHTLRSRRHVRVSLIRMLKTRIVTVGVEVFCLGATFLVFVFAGWHIWKILQRDFIRGSVSPTLMETPTWYIDAAVFTGLVFLLIQLLARTIDVICDDVATDTMEGSCR